MAEEQKTNDLPEVENIDMQEELTKLEDEINTLKQVRISYVLDGWKTVLSR